MKAAARLVSSMIVAMKTEMTNLRDRDERREIARAWNDRYCYRVQFDQTADRLGGTALSGVIPRGGNRWMCPDCNHIHAPTSCSAFSGLQYPACCTTPAGDRLGHGVLLR